MQIPRVASLAVSLGPVRLSQTVDFQVVFETNGAHPHTTIPIIAVLIDRSMTHVVESGCGLTADATSFVVEEQLGPSIR
jgi:hypothetical protein